MHLAAARNSQITNTNITKMDDDEIIEEAEEWTQTTRIMRKKVGPLKIPRRRDEAEFMPRSRRRVTRTQKIARRRNLATRHVGD